MASERKDLLAFYRRYLKRCNEHRFDELGEFVAEDVNGPSEGLSRYIAGLHAVVEAFPDYQWELRHLLVDDQWLAARSTRAPPTSTPRSFAYSPPQRSRSAGDAVANNGCWLHGRVCRG
jgi:predicted ester cyclase